MVPFAKSVGGCLGVTALAPGGFQPTNTIVDFYIESLRPTSGTFRINYEDVEQGADHDMDAIVIYFYEVLDDDGNPVTNPAGRHPGENQPCSPNTRPDVSSSTWVTSSPEPPPTGPIWSVSGRG